LRPELLGHLHPRSLGRRSLALLLGIFVIAGLGLRVAGLGAEGLSEDELNKLQAVEDYKAHGVTAANGEHPMLMKALLTVSTATARLWNRLPPASSHPETLSVSPEAALRFPAALFGAFTAVLIYLIAAELFGVEVGLLAAALWSLDPTAIGLNRIAKEDTFYVFFLALAGVFWLRSQRLKESGSAKSPEPYYWATGAAYGAMIASKYLPHFMLLFLSYNYVFQGLPHRRWRIGRPRYVRILAVAGVVFLLCNPAILLPETWRQMSAFANNQRMGHDSYEFMGTLYNHRFTLWLKGVPWYYYFVFAGTKLVPPTLAAFVVGLPLLFRRRTGDGRYFIFFWLFYWLAAFLLVGGKFTRYFTTVMPCVSVTAAIGVVFTGDLVARRLLPSLKSRAFPRLVLASLVLTASAVASAKVAPHFRLYNNVFGGGEARAGDYFPQDDFYDAPVRDAVFEIARRARPGARVASETPGLADYYADRSGREDIESVSLSDPAAVGRLESGDFIIAARGRRYFSNRAILDALKQTPPAFSVSLGETKAIDVYLLDGATLRLVASAAR
jgi:hypothetical protein